MTAAAQIVSDRTVEALANALGVSWSDLMRTRTKSQRLVLARRRVTLALREFYGLSWPEIGRAMRRTTHTGPRHAYRYVTVEDRLAARAATARLPDLPERVRCIVEQRRPVPRSEAIDEMDAAIAASFSPEATPVLWSEG